MKQSSNEQPDNRGYCRKGSVELRRLDGTLVYTFQPTGVFSSLELTAWPVSDHHNTMKWSGGPAANLYRILGDGSEIGVTNLDTFTEANLPAGGLRTYQVVALSDSGAELQRSNEVTVTSPGQVATFVLQGAPDGSQSVYLNWTNTQYSTQFYDVYQDGVKTRSVAGNATSIFPLEPSHSYQFKVAAVTLSGFVLGWSNTITVTTNQAPPPPPPADARPSRPSPGTIPTSSCWT